MEIPAQIAYPLAALLLVAWTLGRKMLGWSKPRAPRLAEGPRLPMTLGWGVFAPARSSGPALPPRPGAPPGKTALPMVHRL